MVCKEWPLQAATGEAPQCAEAGTDSLCRQRQKQLMVCKVWPLQAAIGAKPQCAEATAGSNR